ncbi:MAG: metallophosphoesterase family protein [Bacteroidetes bacterium]|nr:metallophosphoesterase family protein [Bacteroidota bacterium]
MKIGLLSDTHSFLHPRVFKHFEHCHEIWHAGDIGQPEILKQLQDFKPLRAVYGNIDGGVIRKSCPAHQRFEVEGFRVWITHIGGYPPGYNKEVKKELLQMKTDIFICGHSHLLKIQRDPKLSDMLYINPGAAGKQGFHKVLTLVRFDLKDGSCQNMQVIELGKRGELEQL